MILSVDSRLKNARCDKCMLVSPTFEASSAMSAVLTSRGWIITRHGHTYCPRCASDPHEPHLAE